MQVFAPGSVVAHRESAPLYTLVTVKEPAFDRTGAFGYRVEFKRAREGPPVVRWIAAAYLDPPGDDSEWSFFYWNQDTREYLQGEPGTIETG